MYLYCKNCNAQLRSENINVATDVAKCDLCHAVMKVSLLMNPPKKVESTPPPGSSLKLNKGMRDNMEIVLPKKGFRLKMVSQVLFTLLWLGFITVWTTFAYTGSPIFAMFSIPFWIVGILMLFGVFNQAYEEQTVSLDKRTLTISKKRLAMSNKSVIELDDIAAIALRDRKINPFNSNKVRRVNYHKSLPPVPTVITGSKNFSFFEETEGAEKEWVTEFLNSLVVSLKEKEKAVSF